MKISICIPTWEQYGRGFEFLKNNFKVLLSQTYKNFNVIISASLPLSEFFHLYES